MAALAKRLFRFIDVLDLEELEELDRRIHWLLEGRRQPPPAAPAAEVVKEVTRGAVCFRLELVRCGKVKCACMRGRHRHGPYWYGYRWNKGRTQKKYVGKELPA